MTSVELSYVLMGVCLGIVVGASGASWVWGKLYKMKTTALDIMRQERDQHMNSAEALDQRVQRLELANQTLERSNQRAAVILNDHMRNMRNNTTPQGEADAFYESMQRIADHSQRNRSLNDQFQFLYSQSRSGIQQLPERGDLTHYLPGPPHDPDECGDPVCRERRQDQPKNEEPSASLWDHIKKDDT